MTDLSSEERTFLMDIIRDSTVRDERLAIFKQFSTRKDSEQGWKEYLSANTELHKALAKKSALPLWVQKYYLKKLSSDDQVASHISQLLNRLSDLSGRDLIKELWSGEVKSS